MTLIAPAFLLVAFVSLLALAVEVWVGQLAPWARARAEVGAPAMGRQPGLEQLVPFLAALWLCAVYLQPLFAGLVGVVWVAARIVQAVADRRDPDKRGAGFLIATIATVVLMVGALIGIVLAFARQP